MRREAEQMATLGPLHPAVIDIQAQAERLRHMIDDEIDRAAVAARTEYASAKASEQTLAGNFETLKHTAIDNNEALVGLRELERDAQASRDIYQAFLVRARETGAQEQVDTKNIRVLSKADLPQKRSLPPPSLYPGAGRDDAGRRCRHRHRSGAAAGRSGGAATGHRRDAAHKAYGQGILARGAAAEIPVLAVLPVADVSFGLSAIDDPASPFAREMRKVYDEVRASHMTPGNPSVLVVACDDEDDAATVTLALAALAAATQRVLVIDTDLERRTLSAIDAGDSEVGLVDVAVGRRLLSDAVTRDREHQYQSHCVRGAGEPPRPPHL